MCSINYDLESSIKDPKKQKQKLILLRSIANRIKIEVKSEQKKEVVTLTHTHLQLESFEKLIVLLLRPAFSRLGNRIRFSDLLTRIIQQRRRIIIIIIIIISTSCSCSSSSRRWQRIETHIHWIEEVKPLSCWVLVYKQHISSLPFFFFFVKQNDVCFCCVFLFFLVYK